MKRQQYTYPPILQQHLNPYGGEECTACTGPTHLGDVLGRNESKALQTLEGGGGGQESGAWGELRQPGGGGLQGGPEGGQGGGGGNTSAAGSLYRVGARGGREDDALHGLPAHHCACFAGLLHNHHHCPVSIQHTRQQHTRWQQFISSLNFMSDPFTNH